MNTTKEYLKTKKEAKIYLKSPTDAPKGVQIKRGVRGGYYYDSGTEEKGSKDVKPEEKSAYDGDFESWLNQAVQLAKKGLSGDEIEDQIGGTEEDYQALQDYLIENNIQYDGDIEPTIWGKDSEYNKATQGDMPPEQAPVDDMGEPIEDEDDEDEWSEEQQEIDVVNHENKIRDFLINSGMSSDEAQKKYEDAYDAYMEDNPKPMHDLAIAAGGTEYDNQMVKILKQKNDNPEEEAGPDENDVMAKESEELPRGFKPADVERDYGEDVKLLYEDNLQQGLKHTTALARAVSDAKASEYQPQQSQTYDVDPVYGEDDEEYKTIFDPNSETGQMNYSIISELQEGTEISDMADNLVTTAGFDNLSLAQDHIEKISAIYEEREEEITEMFIENANEKAKQKIKDSSKPQVSQDAPAKPKAQKNEKKPQQSVYLRDDYYNILDFAKNMQGEYKNSIINEIKKKFNMSDAEATDVYNDSLNEYDEE